jgi:hypothetical protein
MPAEELKTAFAAIPAGVTSLNLSWNGLHHKTAEELAVMAGSLQHIIAVFLTLSEIEAMTVDQCLALKNIFPRIKARDIILLDGEGNRLPAGRADLAVSFFREVPSLQALSAHRFLRGFQPGVQESPYPEAPEATEVVCLYLKTF